MSPQILLDYLQARGIRIWADADRLRLDAPAGVLTDEDKMRLAKHKNELLAALSVQSKTCLDCSGRLNLSDRALDVWWCPGCQQWCDGTGRLLDRHVFDEPLTKELIEARRLLADLQAAGCGFVLENDELRLIYPNKMSTALWARFETVGASPAFIKLARGLADNLMGGQDEYDWVH
ncbi:MAG: hypothetical protein JNJ50_26385 [Acidobacteria bacterium]|nr:hypothetical protein [Acidobacteriota bacterium]